MGESVSARKQSLAAETEPLLLRCRGDPTAQGYHSED